MLYSNLFMNQIFIAFWDLPFNSLSSLHFLTGTVIPGPLSVI